MLGGLHAASPSEALPKNAAFWFRLAILHWIAVCGQLAAVLISYYIFSLELPLGYCLATIGLAAVAAVIASIWQLQNRSFSREIPLKKQGHNPLFHFFTKIVHALHQKKLQFFLLFDIAQLALLLFFTGGLYNPFALLMLVPVAVSASILSRQHTVLTALFAIGLLTLLGFFAPPLPWQQAVAALPPYYLLGLWIAPIIAIIFIALYVSALSISARENTMALQQTRLALEKEQQAATIGALAASIAHEMGTPLNTIAVVVKELENETAHHPDLEQDISLLANEVTRCRDILASLGKNMGRDTDNSAINDTASLPLPQLIHSLLKRWHAAEKIVHLSSISRDGSAAPLFADTIELRHGLGNILHNAVHFSRSTIWIDLSWTENNLTLEIRDDGNGFPPEILHRIGEPYISKRPSETMPHLGLGLFTACLLLEKLGFRSYFMNTVTPPQGAKVVLQWQKPQ